MDRSNAKSYQADHVVLVDFLFMLADISKRLCAIWAALTMAFSLAATVLYLVGRIEAESAFVMCCVGLFCLIACIVNMAFIDWTTHRTCRLMPETGNAIDDETDSD